VSKNQRALPLLDLALKVFEFLAVQTCNNGIKEFLLASGRSWNLRQKRFKQDAV
jgi:hypothetical protein